VHGLTDADVVDAPTIADVYEQLTRILSGASRVIIYNVEFDKAKLNRSLAVRELKRLASSIVFECAMESYAEWCGEWSDYYGSFKWQPLPFGDHTALGDCLGTLKLLKMMAEA
jgi:DNA polymerase-3 subunit epsilon